MQSVNTQSAYSIVTVTANVHLQKSPALTGNRTLVKSLERRTANHAATDAVAYISQLANISCNSEKSQSPNCKSLLSQQI